jgi:hypothetical protein
VTALRVAAHHPRSWSDRADRHPREVTAKPRSRYIADLVGVNLFAGVADHGIIATSTGGRIVPADFIDGPAFAVIPPNAVALFREAPDGSPRNVWPVTVADIDRHADRVRVRLDGPVALVAEITPPPPMTRPPARRRHLGQRQSHGDRDLSRLRRWAPARPACAAGRRFR